MSNMSALKDLTITVKPLASILNCSPSSIYTAIKENTFPFPVIRIGERIVIPTAPVREALGLNLPEVA